MTAARLTIFCVGIGALTLCLGGSAVSSDEKPTSPPFHDRLREIAREYKKYQPVDYDAKWAPELCNEPRPYRDYTPAEARFSGSKDAESHGQKLYFLFAQQKDAYLKLSDKPSAVGQVIVKESWVPLEAKEEDLKKHMARRLVESVPFARKGDKLFRAGEQGELFVMFKLDAKTADTDNGWVYGTVTPDGKKVTSAGRVDSCMSCHKDAKHDRLFGAVKSTTTLLDAKAK